MDIEHLFLVWNAEMSLRGGLAYVADRLRGADDECALCSLAYDGLSEKPSFKECKRSVGLPFDGVYKNRLDAAQAEVAGGDVPCVLARRTDGALLKLLGRTDIEACEGDLDAFAARLRAALERARVGG